MKKKLKKYILLLVLSFQYFSTWAAPVQIQDSVHIKGHFLQKFQPGTVFQIIVQQKYTNPGWTAFSETYKALLDSEGRFELSFLPKDRLFYCSYIFENADKKVISFSNIQRAAPVFLMEAGDDFSVDIDTDVIRFRGSGAAKMNCQYLVNINPVYPRYTSGVMSNLVETKQFEKELDYWREAIEDNLKINLGILDAYSSQLSDSVARILRYDYIGEAYKAVYAKFLTENSVSFDFDIYKRKLDSLKLKIPEANDDLAAFSQGYINYLYVKENTKTTFANSNRELQWNYSYAKLFDQILKRDAGLVRDNLLLASYFNSMRNKMDSFSFESKIKDNIADGYVKEFYGRWLKRNGVRTPAFPFKLPDTLGNMHMLKNFKGKVLIVDFWFNGCGACAVLNKSMDPIIQKYKYHPKVQFLSISVGDSKEVWIRGIRTGKYTHPEQIMLSTHGTRTLEAEIVKYYNYNSFPRLLLIDKQGRNVMINAPNPGLDGGKALISKIEELL